MKRRRRRPLRSSTPTLETLSESGGGTQDISVAWGKEFSRGHVMLAADYTHRDRLKRGDRSYLDCAHDNVVDEQGNSMDILDPRTGERRCAGPIQNMLLITDLFGGNGLPTTPTGNPYDVVQPVTPGSRLDEFLPPINDPNVGFVAPGFIGVPDFCREFNDVATGQPRNPDVGTPEEYALCRTGLGLENQYSTVNQNSDVIPKLNRYTFYGDASYELTDNVELYGEALYNRRKTETNGARQLFFFQFPSNDYGFNLVSIFCSASRAATHNCKKGEAGDPLNNISGVILFRPVIEIASNNATDVKYRRGVVGARGDFGNNFLAGNWHYDAYFQASRSDGDYTNDRVFQDAVDSQEWRSHLCAGTTTRIRGVPCMDIDWTDPRILAGNFTPAEQAFLFGRETGNTLYKQHTAEASASGDVLQLPAGPLGVALGAQWRRDSINDTPGPITQAGNAWGQSVSDPTRGHSITKEVFGELQAPLVRDVPFIQNLNLSAAARMTNVFAQRDVDGKSANSKGNWTYKIGLNWQTNEWLRFRGTLGTSYRAPALFEQFLGDTTSFPSQLSIDPCIRWGTGLAQGTLPQRIADRCQALGIPQGYSGAGSAATLFSGGGIGVLKPETSKAKTVSVVVTPLAGLWSGNRLSLAVDYFSIDVKGEIAQLGAANIIFRCMNSSNYPNDPACSLFTRAAPGSAEFPNILTVRDAFINVNEEKNRGVDLTGQMTQDLGRFGKLSALAQMTWSIEDTVQLFEGSDVTGEGTSGEPKWVGDFRFTWDKGPWSLFWGINVVGGTSDEQNLRDAQGDTCFTNNVYGGTVCPIYRLSPTFYHNVSITRNIGDRFQLILGVSNLFDTHPPLVSNAFSTAFISTIGNAPTFGTQYDFIGRRAFVSVKAKF